MRFGMYVRTGPPRLGAMVGSDALVDLHAAAHALARGSTDPEDAALPALVPDDSSALLRNGPLGLAGAAKIIRWIDLELAADRTPYGIHGEAILHRLEDVRLCAPVLAPEKIIGVGLNYRSHAEEQGARIPDVPMIFAKWNNTLIGPTDDIVYPEITEGLDYEAELGVVIGRRARNVEERDALAYVAGYTVVNDVTARDVQLSDRQWVRGKSPDTLCPVGPMIVTPDEIDDLGDLRIRLWVGDEERQNDRTSSMIFGVARLVHFLSRSFTLEPGDLIATGTPAGVGFAQDPPRFLQRGDVVRTSIDGLGELRNQVVSAEPGGTRRLDLAQ